MRMLEMQTLVSPDELNSLSQIYRITTPGISLQETLNEMIENNQISSFVAGRILEAFDKISHQILETKTKNKLSIKGQVVNYRFCEGVWTIVIKDVEVKDFALVKKADYLKIVAVDTKASENKQ